MIVTTPENYNDDQLLNFVSSTLLSQCHVLANHCDMVLVSLQLSAFRVSQLIPVRVQQFLCTKPLSETLGSVGMLHCNLHHYFCRIACVHKFTELFSTGIHFPKVFRLFEKRFENSPSRTSSN